MDGKVRFTAARAWAIVFVGGLRDMRWRGAVKVAALRHPCDNWQDRSLYEKPPDAFFAEWPRQGSRLIAAFAYQPDWKDRIAMHARGPRIGAVGHSAGGYTVIGFGDGTPTCPGMAGAWNVLRNLAWKS